MSNRDITVASVLICDFKQLTGRQYILGLLYLINIRDLLESGRIVRHRHRQNWKGEGGHPSE